MFLSGCGGAFDASDPNDPQPKLGAMPPTGAEMTDPPPFEDAGPEAVPTPDAGAPDVTPDAIPIEPDAGALPEASAEDVAPITDAAADSLGTFGPWSCVASSGPLPDGWPCTLNVFDAGIVLPSPEQGQCAAGACVPSTGCMLGTTCTPP
jgi:hypothetical protein